MHCYSDLRQLLQDTEVPGSQVRQPQQRQRNSCEVLLDLFKLMGVSQVAAKAGTASNN